MYFLYFISKKDLNGYFPSGWIKADNQIDALTQLIATRGVSEHHIELSYQCTDEEFSKEWQSGKYTGAKPL